MNSCSFTLFIFAAVIFLRCLRSTGAVTCHPDDEASLLAFKSGITRDPLGLLSDWKKGTDCCYWRGVACFSGDHVTALSISGGDTPLGRGYLWGTISPSLAKLQHLEHVSFDSLKITGSFPLFLFQLPRLHVFHITDTHLSGPLPANIGAVSKVGEVTIDIGNNRFTGPIPSSISNLTQLTWLNLAGNRLSGTIPSSISNLTWLTWLNLAGNRLSGTIPSSISNLTRLTSLSLAGNRLSGTIPDIFKSMTELTALNLSRNGFTGKLPQSIVSLRPTLELLDLSQNNLSGTIPTYLSRFHALSTLDLSRNQFSGVVPMGFANLTRIFHLRLSHNLLTGPLPALNFAGGIGSLDLSYNRFQLETIPKWVTSSPIIFSLKLAKCGIKMSLDDWKPMKIRSFEYIDLSENEISGSTGKFLNQAEALLEFLASGNKLRFDLGKLNFTKSLRILDLSRNLVFGKVPASVAGLEKLNLSQNHLCGKLPMTKFSASVFAGNDCLCGSPLSPCKA